MKVWRSIHEGSLRMKGPKWGQDYDHNIINFFPNGDQIYKI